MLFLAPPELELLLKFLLNSSKSKSISSDLSFDLEEDLEEDFLTGCIGIGSGFFNINFFCA
jgi:hypothetical protein